MHKISLLSKEVSDIYEFYWNLFNDHLFYSYLFFHILFPLPPALSLVHSLLAYATDLGFASLEYLFCFVLSSTFHCFLCKSTLLFLGFSQYLLRVFVPLLSCSHLILSMHYQH
jgi:hypothetical protein